jgi:hypothetical protein
LDIGRSPNEMILEPSAVRKVSNDDGMVIIISENIRLVPGSHGDEFGTWIQMARSYQTVSFTMTIAPQGHSWTQMPQPLQ